MSLHKLPTLLLILSTTAFAEINWGGDVENLQAIEKVYANSLAKRARGMSGQDSNSNSAGTTSGTDTSTSNSNSVSNAVGGGSLANIVSNLTSGSGANVINTPNDAQSQATQTQITDLTNNTTSSLDQMVKDYQKTAASLGGGSSSDSSKKSDSSSNATDPSSSSSSTGLSVLKHGNSSGSTSSKTISSSDYAKAADSGFQDSGSPLAPPTSSLDGTTPLTLDNFGQGDGGNGNLTIGQQIVNLHDLKAKSGSSSQ